MNEVSPARPKADGPEGNAPGVNRREHPRRPCRYEAMCRSAGRAWWPVVFVDLSLGGAGVILSSPIEPGAAVAFTVHTPHGRVLQLRAHVRRIEAREYEWLAGCEFDRRLTEAEFAELV
jgi:hypothetical protein